LGIENMEVKQTAELSKFIGTITSAKISAFIDLKKLCQSRVYGLAVQMGAEHAATHGDFGYLNNLLGLLDGTQYGKSLVASLRPKLTFVLSGAEPRKFKKATAEQVAEAAKKELAMPVKAKTDQVKVPPKKKAPVSNDIMDSRLMLPGSYGTGKRR
jgi:hypothetical protein